MNLTWVLYGEKSKNDVLYSVSLKYSVFYALYLLISIYFKKEFVKVVYFTIAMAATFYSFSFIIPSEYLGLACTIAQVISDSS